MNNDNSTSSSQGRRTRLQKKSASLHQCKKLSKCVPSHSKQEQNGTLASPASSLKDVTKEKAIGRKSTKSNKKMTIESNFTLCNLVDDENVTSINQKEVLHKSNCSPSVSNIGLEKSSSKKNKPVRSKRLNVDGRFSNENSNVCVPSEEITNLLCSISLSSRKSECNDGSLGISKEQVNNLNTNITFSPICSSQESGTEDLNNSVANIIKTLVEEKNETVSKRPSNSSPENEDPNAVKNILKGVTAYVEVRSGHENRTKAIERELHRMGAKIVQRFLSTTTHVIFKDGRKSTRDKAVARNIPLVSVLWVESCKQQRYRVAETDFPAIIPEMYDSPLPSRRIRKLKSMQPKDFNVEFAGSIERLNKIFSRIRQDNENSASDSFCGGETSASIKGDDTASDDNVDYTPTRCKIPVATCRLFDSSVDENKVNQLENTERVNENDRYSKHKKKNPDSSALPAEVTVKRRKLFSDLNQSPQLVASTPNCVKKKVKSNSTPRKKKPRSKAGVGMSVKLLTNAKNENLQIENMCTNSSVSCITDKCTQHEDGKDVVGGDLLITNLKQDPRSSLDDFASKKQRKEKSIKKKFLIGSSFDSNNIDNPSVNEMAVKRSAIVLTSLQSIEREVIYSIIESLGGFRVKNSVTEITTHVVSGDNRRTLSILFGLVRGCWLLSSQWVYKSMEAGHWLEEESFQLAEYSHVSQVIRLERANHGPDYGQNLFGQLGSIFVSSQCSPSYDNITELITLSGGKVSTCLRKCEVLIGPHIQSRRESKSVVHLSEKWILDCISQNKILLFDEYKM